MAIDPKELRIGSHYYNDGYVKPVIGRITSINGRIYRPDDMTVGLIYDMPLDEDSDPYESTMAINLEPIPITEDLLKELGFKPYDTCWRKDLDDEQYVVVKIRNEYNTARVKTKGICAYNIFHFKYLHELESFVYMTTQQELIND